MSLSNVGALSCMRVASELFIDRVNLITGQGSGSGKTTFAKEAARSIHARGQSVAMLAVGVEGLSTQDTMGEGSSVRIKETQKGNPIVNLRSGDVFVSSENLLGLATCSPAIVDVVAGSTALGRLFIARAMRDGRAVLVGPHANEYLGWIVRRIREEAWARTVIVDGALDRLTQVASIPEAQLFYTLRVDKSNYVKAARWMRHFFRLVSLPHVSDDCDGACRYMIKGPLTSYALEAVPTNTKMIVVQDFSKVFLSEDQLVMALRKYKLEVVEKIPFRGFAVFLKGVTKDEFSTLLGEELCSLVLSFDVCSGVEL